MPRYPLLLIGCAGWSIASRNAVHFPEEGSHLERYARVFDAVEIDSSFYRPHQHKTYARWAASTPRDFRFAVKMPKTISHQKRLRDCAAELGAFLEQAGGLGDKLGVLLLQLPPGFAFEPKIVSAFFDLLRSNCATQVACEPRHASWFDAAADRLLRDFGVARVGADPARVPRASAPAGDHRLEYLRLHGSPRMYRDAYSDAALQRIAARLTRRSALTRERWCIFDNTAEGHAIGNALELKALLAHGH
ncbi:MAG TPA: DUF72 domain-containing protein [Rhodanobacteraceae bacterium]|nr:DUF72 domain-containing protein [Rhodanobacteraceae bacterium]